MAASALEKAISTAEASVDSLSWWLLIATLVVVVGLIVEYSPDVKKLLTDRPLNRKLLVEMAGGVLVTIGVTGELAVQGFQSKADTRLRDANRLYVSFLHSEALSLEAANLALEAQIQPRRLNAGEIDAAAKALRPFAGKTVKISSHPNDVDAAILGAQIIDILSRADMGAVDRRMTYQSFGAIGIGVLVSGGDDNLVAALIAALPPKLGAKRGEPPKGYPTITIAGEDSVTANATIFVGAKPLPAP